MGNLPELFDLSGRVAVVTGGAGLLGAEFCHTLVGAGASIVIADYDEAAAQKIAASLNKSKTDQISESHEAIKRAFAIQVDISAKGSVQQLIEKTKFEFGRLDILVNSAAWHHYLP